MKIIISKTIKLPNAIPNTSFKVGFKSRHKILNKENDNKKIVNKNGVICGHLR